MQKPSPTHHKQRPGLTIQDIHDLAIRIRDELEPEVAHKGPEVLTSDALLELASFFSLLLEHSTYSSLTERPATSPSLIGLNRGDVAAPKLTLYDLRKTSIHKALLCITGQGTRWPTKLIELCDFLKEQWTDIFGDLSMIRPLLYEKDGILHHVKEEKGMSRHAVLVKWLSDRTSLVSPLRAWESGHLEYTPGQWWIHTIFAFHDGIIDSPDPHGGITADGDGAYAITLTGADELESESAELFTYRTRAKDNLKHRLLQTFTPPRRPVRVLRSHTLHSLWSPIVGVRYDGLYKIVTWSLSTGKGGEIHIDVRLQREPGQRNIDDILKLPNCEQRDAYVEYRRLRELRSGKLNDATKPYTKLDRFLGTIPALQEPIPEADLEKEAVGDFPSRRRGAIVPGEQPNVTEDEFLNAIMLPDKDAGEIDSGQANEPRIPSLDGTEGQVSSSTGRDASTSQIIEDLPGSPPGGTLPSFYYISSNQCCDDCDHVDATTDNKTRVKDKRTYPVTKSYTLDLEQEQIMLNHSSLRDLNFKIGKLERITAGRGTISREFHGDVVEMLAIAQRLQSHMVESFGLVDRCVLDLVKRLLRMANAADLAESPVWGAGNRIAERATPAQIERYFSLG